MTQTAGKILERLDELPSLPAVYHRVRETLEDPEGSLESVAAIIETDPALTARLLRVANSALYGLAAKVDNVLRALTIIGATETHHLVLATTLISVFRDLPLGPVSMRSFWEHSIACGIAARVIARVGGRASPDHAYLAGLLHDLGRLPLFILEPHLMSAALQAHRDRQGHLHRLELQFFGSSHADIGAAMLRDWKIPEVFCEAAEHHHRAAIEQSVGAETAITHVADLIVNSLRIGTSGTRWTPVLDDQAWHAVGLEAGQLPAVVETTIATTRDVTSAFLEH
ncbi:HDOD domain-containing protein [Thiorhodococcus mannitoliphagus]|uniref:HDOD domain-containing protein n=1 Tax=Thiorhodococcus mannitoliphagus TaxID=329406 RepID=A0A6P1E1M4_9GAMM|nr:HDOD domain-containing protein [Thiorhodococcus mannitoliphagus]NEX23123.1 HDOD domain-containing protein [Thiorhodococcus mannitoliphagus]